MRLDEGACIVRFTTTERDDEAETAEIDGEVETAVAEENE